MRISRKVLWGIIFVAVVIAATLLLLHNTLHVTTNIHPESKPEYSVLDGGPAIRYPCDDEWTLLEDILPVPREWANQDFAGRNKITNMSNILQGNSDGIGALAGDPNPMAFFLNAEDGWFVFSLPINLGPVDDTYIYRTEDGGHTWKEISHIMGTDYDMCWFSTTCLAFSNEKQGFLGTGLFTDAPVLVTEDGGCSWNILDVPAVDDGLTYQADHIIFYGSNGVITFHSGNVYTAITTSDYGQSWQLSSPRFAFAEGGGPAYLPFTLEDLPIGIYSDHTHDNDPIRLLGDLPEQGIAMYGLSWASVGIGGTLLIEKEDNTIKQLSRYDIDITPQSMEFYDYDNDGNKEVVVVVDNFKSGQQSIYLFRLGELSFEEIEYENAPELRTGNEN